MFARQCGWIIVATTIVLLFLSGPSLNAAEQAGIQITVINHHTLIIDWGGIGLHAAATDYKSPLPRSWFHEFPSKNAYNWPGGCAANDKTVFIGNDDGSFLAIAADKGTLRWQQQTDGMHRGTPLLTADTVYTGTIACWCYAMDVNNGDIRWKTKAPPRRIFDKLVGVSQMHVLRCFLR